MCSEKAMTEAQQAERIPALEFEVWWGLIAGPLAWALNEGTDYALTQHACSTGHFYVLRVTSVVCILVALSGFALAFAVHRRLPRDPETEEELPRDRAYFLCIVGIAMSIAFAIIVISQVVPQWILSPCS
jgi:hypothetical protein